jgi:hypothetical protein
LLNPRLANLRSQRCGPFAGRALELQPPRCNGYPQDSTPSQNLRRRSCAHSRPTHWRKENGTFIKNS